MSKQVNRKALPANQNINRDAPLGATPEERIENGTASQDDLMQVASKVESGETTVAPEVEQEMQQDGLIQQPTATPIEQQPQAPSVAQYDRKASMESLMSGLNMADESKEKMSNIFQAYKEGKIDKAQRNYFLGDAISRMAQDWENRWERGVNRGLWNPEKGVAVPEASTGDNEWQQYLKTDWLAAQELKNEARKKAVEGKIDRDLSALEAAGKQNYAMNISPEIYRNSELNKMSDEERVNFLMTNSVANGAPLSADDLNNVVNTIDMVNNAKGKKQEELRGMVAANDGLDWSNMVSQITALNEKKRQELDLQLKEGQITQQEYNNQLLEIEKSIKTVDSAVAEATKDYMIDKARIDNVKAAYGGTSFTFKVGFGVWGAGTTISADTLINAGYDIKSMIDKGIGDDTTEGTQLDKNAREAAGLTPGGTF